MEDSSDNKRIAKNSMMLYVNMLYSLCISLYTSRVILNALGFEDYGLYNVIGSVVAMFIFLRSAMGNSIHRFITYSIGKGNIEEVNKVFSSGILIHFLLGVVIVLIAETIGLWFLNTYMVIPDERLVAANWIYQFSIVSVFLSVICVPYDALIIAHEKMSAFAFVQVLNSTLNLLIVLFINSISYDRLIVYGLLLMLMQVVNRIIYGIYCKKHFPEYTFILVRDRSLLKEITCFAGWALVGNIAYIGYTQGLNIILNIYFNPAINAARGISYNIQGALKGFTTNIQTAVNPQITKAYVVGEIERLHKLIVASSKLSYYLLFSIVISISSEIEEILRLWLVNVPNYAVSFTLLIFASMLIDPLANPLLIANRATGRIKNYQLSEGCLLLLILPISWFFLKLGYNPESVFIVQLVIFVVTQVARVFLVCHYIKMSYGFYFRKIIYPISIVSIISTFIPVLLHFTLESSIENMILTCLISFVNVLTIAYCLGLDASEKLQVNYFVKKIVFKLIKK